MITTVRVLISGGSLCCAMLFATMGCSHTPTPETTIRASHHNEDAANAIARGDTLSAALFARNAYDEAAKGDDQEQRLRAMMNLGEVAYVSGNLTAAATYFSEVESRLATGAVNRPQWRLVNLYNLLRVTLDREVIKMPVLGQNGVPLLDENKKVRWEVRPTVSTELDTLLALAEKLYAEAPEKKVSTQAYLLLAKLQIQVRRKQLSEAEETLRKARGLFESIEDLTGVGATFGDEAEIRMQQKQYAKALDLLGTARDFAIKAEVPSEIAYCLSRAATIHRIQSEAEDLDTAKKMEHLRDAADTRKRALDVNKQVQNHFRIAEDYDFLADVAERLERLLKDPLYQRQTATFREEALKARVTAERDARAAALPIEP